MKHPSLKQLFDSLDATSTLGNDTELARLLSGVKTADRSWKITRPGRHAIANKFLVDHLLSSGISVSRIADVGVSSGVTTTEFLSDLESAGFAISEIFAVDRYFDACMVRLAPDFHAFVENHGHILRLEFGKLNFSPWCSKMDWFTGIAVAKKIMGVIAKAKLRTIDFSKDSKLQDINTLRRVRLLSPSLENQPKALIMEHDLFERFDREMLGRFDLVRAANVFNLRRLSESGIKTFALNLGELCREGGLLFICRSEKDSVRASLFIIRSGCLELVGNLNGGVDSEPLLRNLSLTT